MAKITEVEALALLVGATDLLARVASLIPTLAQALQDVKNGLNETNASELNDKIVLAHADVQNLNDQLQALRNG